jgi:hypothetical protein
MADRIKVRLFIVALAIAAALLFFNKNYLISKISALKDYQKEFATNIVSDKNLGRQRPMSTFEQEEQLRQFIPPVFESFSEKDWDEFWNTIYGAFPDESSSKKFMPKKYRQLTMSEIEQRLINRYPNGFGRMGQQHWGYFWQYIIKVDS